MPSFSYACSFNFPDLEQKIRKQFSRFMIKESQIHIPDLNYQIQDNFIFHI